MEGRRAGCGRCEYGDERAASPHFVVGWLRLLALVSLSAAPLVSAFAASQFFVIAGLLHKRSAQSGSIWQRYRCSKFDKWHLTEELVALLLGGPRGVPPPIYEYSQSHGRVRTPLAGRGQGLSELPLLARGGLADPR